MGERERPVGPPWVTLPEVLDRRMRLGPFPSARDALKFATYAAVGAVPAALIGPIWWIPFLGGGLLAATYHPDGKPPDERAGEFVAYRWRNGPGFRGRPPRQGTGFQGSAAPIRGATLVAVIEVGGTPVAFLPPEEARARFDRFRELLRGIDGNLYVVMTTEATSGAPFRPPDEVAPPAPRARSGYAEMIRLMCERRRRRKVLLVVGTPRDDGASTRLDRTVSVLTEHLGRLGAPYERLRDDRLAAALERLGWDREAPP